MSELESLSIGGYEVNNETVWLMRKLSNNPPAKRVDWLESPDADGSVPATIPTLERMTIEAELELVANVTMDAALDELGLLLNKLQECEQMRPGQPVTRTPADSTRTRTTYAMVGEIVDLPVEATGDMSGWLRSRPVVKIRLECVPYWLGTAVDFTAVTNTDPIQILNLANVAGDIPAFGIVTYTDGATQKRGHFEIGADYTTDTARSYLIDSDSLVTTDMAGAGNTRTGAYDPGAAGSSIIRATLFSTPVVVCATAALTHIGTFKAKLRVYGAGTGTISVRVDHRVGTGSWTQGAWVSVPNVGAFYEVDCGLVDFKQVTSGTQDGRVRIVAKSATNSDTIDIDYLLLLPTAAFYGVARERSEPANTITAYDDFGVTSAALDGDTAPLGGAWDHLGSGTGVTGVGDATDWTVPASSGYALRQPGAADTALAGGLSGALARLGSGIVAGSARTAVLVGSPGTGTSVGLLTRYQAADEFLLCYISWLGGAWLFLDKFIAGVRTTIGSIFVGDSTGPWVVDLSIDAAGKATASASLGIGSTPTPRILVTDAALATAGTLADGGYGLFSRIVGAADSTRHYDVGVYPAPSTYPALNSTQDFELRHDEARVEGAAGGLYSDAFYRGGYALIPPKGDDNLTTRLVAKARRNDVVTSPDDNIADSGTLDAQIFPRFLVPR